jgi:hypothetical protein
MYGAIRQIELMNPPWVTLDTGFVPFNGIEPEEISFSLSLQDAVQAKLDSIDTSQSVELRRFVTLTAHELSHQQTKWFDLREQVLFYHSSGAPINFGSRHRISFLADWLSSDEMRIFQSEAHQLHKLLLLNFVFDLIDRVVDYWNEVALARHVWRSFSGAFRRFLENSLQFKPFHTPLRLFPSSIHPISSAA